MHLPTVEWTFRTSSFLYKTIGKKKIHEIFYFCRQMTNTKLLKGNRVLANALLIYSYIHSHSKRKDSPRIQNVLLIFRLNLKYLGWPYREYSKTAKNGGFCEELLSENDFEAILATFCCYDYGAKAFEAVQKTTADEKDYHKCSSCVIVC